MALRPTFVIHGAATGADLLAGGWAHAHGVFEEAYPADWSQGKSAGPRRNARMLAEGKPDRGLAFGALWKRATLPPHTWPNNETWKRTGTGDMVKRMLDAGIPVRWLETPGRPAIDLTEMPGPPARGA